MIDDDDDDDNNNMLKNEEEIEIEIEIKKRYPKAKGTLHEIIEPSKLLYCPVKNKTSTYLVWQISGTEYDTYCNLCGNQVNYMKNLLPV